MGKRLKTRAWRTRKRQRKALRTRKRVRMVFGKRKTLIKGLSRTGKS